MRGRLERLRGEAAATEREKEEKRKAKEAARAAAGSAPPRRSAAKSKSLPGATRMKYVWAVCDRRGDPVKTFPFPQKAAAEEELARINAASDRKHPHMLQKLRVPMDA